MEGLPTSPVRVVALVVALGVLLAAAAVVTAPAGRVLVVEDATTGEQYLSVPVENGTTVALTYTHSVERSRVVDYYRVAGDSLVNTRMEFESYGWGLPARVDVTIENGTFVYDPPDPIGRFESLSVSPGRIADHHLTVGERTFDLVARTDARDVTLHVDRHTTLAIFK